MADILSITVKRDRPAKLITFYGMLLAQTDEDQYNVAFQAESSTGKSYIPLELVEYFPKDERMIYAGASPTSFYHEVGTWDKGRKIIKVNLENKILIFLDQPHWQLMERLRPLLSHDQKVLTYKITDRKERAGLRTKTVEIIGYPSVIFCTAKPTLEDQERTRMWLLSPETTQEKLRESLYLLAQKEGNREAFKEWLNQDPRLRWLRERITLIRQTGIRNVIMSDEDKILKRFLERKESLTPRDQRDFPRLIRLIKGITLYNCFHRERTGPSTIKANDEDVEEGFKLYESCAKSNELGLSPETYEIYEKVVQPQLDSDAGLDKKGILSAYLRIYHRPLSFRRLRDEILPSLESAGLITQEPDPTDKRRMLVYPTVQRDISKGPEPPTQPTQPEGSEKYVPKDGGVDSTKILRTSQEDHPANARNVSGAVGVSSAPPQPELPAEGEIVIDDLLPILRREWTSGFEEGFIDLCVRIGHWTREEGRVLFDLQVQKGRILTDPEGRWRWVDS